MTKIKIYCWDNSPGVHGWHHGLAMTEGGDVILGHMSSSSDWCRKDMLEMHRPDYAALYGEDGFELVWLEILDADPGWLTAVELNRRKGEIAAVNT